MEYDMMTQHSSRRRIINPIDARVGVREIIEQPTWKIVAEIKNEGNLHAVDGTDPDFSGHRAR